MLSSSASTSTQFPCARRSRPPGNSSARPSAENLQHLAVHGPMPRRAVSQSTITSLEGLRVGACVGSAVERPRSKSRKALILLPATPAARSGSRVWRAETAVRGRRRNTRARPDEWWPRPCRAFVDWEPFHKCTAGRRPFGGCRVFRRRPRAAQNTGLTPTRRRRLRQHDQGAILLRGRSTARCPRTPRSTGCPTRKLWSGSPPCASFAIWPVEMLLIFGSRCVR